MASLIEVKSVEGRDDLLDVVYNSVPCRMSEVRVRKSSIRSFGCAKSNAYVELNFTDGSVINLEYEYIDNVLGTVPTSNVHLHTLLKSLM